jgi:hypothetical protein
LATDLSIFKVEWDTGLRHQRVAQRDGASGFRFNSCFQEADYSDLLLELLMKRQQPKDERKEK